MSNPSNVSHRDQVLADLFARLENATHPGPIIDAICHEHPELATEIRETAAVQGLLADASVADDPMPGRLGSFRMVSEIGRGGMGVVYEAIQEPFERRVAVKVLKERTVSETTRQRFLREQFVLKQLHQTHIVPIFAGGDEQGLSYFAMPFIQGASLDRVLWEARESCSGDTSGSTPSLGHLAGRCHRNKDHNGNGAATTSDQERPPNLRDNAEEATESRPPRTPHSAPAARNARTFAVELSREYFRSVASVLADAAEGMHHAHAVGFVHRDLKPSNLMVDEAGHCWIIDFGLAGVLDRGADEAPMPVKQDMTHAAVGTLQYMAPEQFDRDEDRVIDSRSDVWGLGVTLYELLTLERAFGSDERAETRRQIREEDPPPPRTLLPAIPADLDAICRKSLRKDQGLRYQSCGELASDLRRWLSGEPTLAHPARLPRKLWLWARREKSQAATVGVCMLLIATLVWALLENAGTKLAESRAEAAEFRAAAADAESERAIAASKQAAAEWALELRGVTMRRVGEHQARWSRRNEGDIEKLARVPQDNASLRDEATANLAGLDVHELSKKAVSATHVAFDATGDRVAFVRLGDGQETRPVGVVWDLAADAITASTEPGAGPVGFAEDGHALQLIAASATEFWLWDIGAEAVVGKFTVASAGNDPENQQDLVGEGLQWRVAALSTRGTLVAASAAAAVIDGDDGASSGVTLVWRREEAVPAVRVPFLATSLDISPDDHYLAIGTADGTVILWEIDRDQEVARLHTGRLNVTTVKFSPRLAWDLGDAADDPRGRLLLATGGTGGHLTVWDVAKRQRVSDYLGSAYEVYAIAFSPDGTLLATAGRYRAKIWDVRTGDLLLNVPAGNTIVGIDFSPRGDRLAIASVAAHGSPGEVAVHEIENGRGILTLRGLRGQARQVAFSLDNARIAVLTDHWEIGVYGMATGQLQRILSAPAARFGDNAAITFNRDGSQLAFSAAHEARSWDVLTGRQLGAWMLPPGLLDRLTYDASGRLLSFRAETAAKGKPRTSVCRIRVLGEPDTIGEPSEYPDLNAGVLGAMVVPGRGLFVVDGWEFSGGDPKRRIVALDASAAELWSVDSTRGKMGPYMTAGASGAWVGFAAEAPDTMTIVDAESGRFIQTIPASIPPTATTLAAFASAAERRLHVDQDGGYLLFRGNKPEPILRVAFDKPSTQARQFSSDGRQIAIGHTDGSVSIYNLDQLRGKLNRDGLGW